MASFILMNLAWVILFMSVVWLVSVRLEDVSIVDPCWSLCFMLIAYRSYVDSEALLKHSETAYFKTILCLMVILWGGRLFLFLLKRKIGKPEDPRYTDFRKRFGPQRYWWFSLFQVFWLQAFLAWLISLPIQVAMLNDGKLDSIFGGFGGGIFLFGFIYESIADDQMAAHKEARALGRTHERVFSGGLWKYSRHPNYFGEFLLWWGIWIFTLQSSGTLILVGSPLLLSWLLLKVSGVALLDAHQVERKPEYQSYIDSTPAFLPSWLGGKARCNISES